MGKEQSDLATNLQNEETKFRFRLRKLIPEEQIFQAVMDAINTHALVIRCIEAEASLGKNMEDIHNAQQDLQRLARDLLTI